VTFASRGSLTAALVAAVLGCGGGAEAPPEAAAAPPADTIRFREFSSAPSLARSAGSQDPRSPDYGALSIFVRRTALLGHLGHSSIEAMLDAWDVEPLLWPERCAL
jgi:hypothetical protein